MRHNYSVSQFKPRNQDSLSEGKFQKSGRKYEIIGNTLPSTAILAFFAIDFYCLESFQRCTRHLDRSFNCAGKHTEWVFPRFSVPFCLPGYLVYCTNIQTWTYDGSLYEVDDFGEGSYIQWKHHFTRSGFNTSACGGNTTDA
jgi:peptide/nickel transport system permease protein